MSVFNAVSDYFKSIYLIIKKAVLPVKTRGMPNEVLLGTLKYMKTRKDLEELQLVCKRFNRVIRHKYKAWPHQRHLIGIKYTPDVYFREGFKLSVYNLEPIPDDLEMKWIHLTDIDFKNPRPELRLFNRCVVKELQLEINDEVTIQILGEQLRMLKELGGDTIEVLKVYLAFKGTQQQFERAQIYHAIFKECLNVASLTVMIYSFPSFITTPTVNEFLNFPNTKVVLLRNVLTKYEWNVDHAKPFKEFVEANCVAEPRRKHLGLHFFDNQSLVHIELTLLNLIIQAFHKATLVDNFFKEISFESVIRHKISNLPSLAGFYLAYNEVSFEPIGEYDAHGSPIYRMKRYPVYRLNHSSLKWVLEAKMRRGDYLDSPLYNELLGWRIKPVNLEKDEENPLIISR